MPLINLKTILANARKEKYAVGSFNFNSYEDVKGMIQGAKDRNAPIIVMASPSTTKYIGIKTTYGMVKGLAEDYNVPVTLHLDHTKDVDFIFKCIDAGFTSVMIDASERPYEENIETSKRVADYAHKFNCSVEAELGMIGGREDDKISENELYTNPDDVPRFVKETGVDALAVAVGTVHGFYKSEPNIDFDRIAKIYSLTDIPLVLHGGTGVSTEAFKKAISCGVSKINVGTELKYVYSEMLRKAVATLPDENDPRKFMAMVTEKCSEIIKGKIDIFGTEGKA